jgi:tRNA A-37 threonylcarbamoyl transferase component Bud32
LDGGEASVLEARWQAVLAQWADGDPVNEVWRLSRPAHPNDPTQGWKLHVSATILSASALLERAGPILRASGARYKVPLSLLSLKRLNCGLFYGYSQIGKALTIYPRSSGEACEIAFAVHEATVGLPGPEVPFEHRCFARGGVYRRYGSFESLFTEGAEPRPAIRGPGGVLEEDRRDQNPAWAPPDPFAPLKERRRGKLATAFRAYSALSQRGKGGVYRAIDVRTGVRPCIVKEGRRYGEVDWDGTDGRHRVEHEADVLRELTAAEIPAPTVLALFRERADAYLVLEAIDGRTLHEVALQADTKLSMMDALGFARQCAELLARIHDLGWVWRDCKPTNLLIDSGTLRPLDFEGAIAMGSDPQLPWGSAGFVPPEWRDADEGRHPVLPSQDLYALGALIHSILAGSPPPATAAPRPIGVYRRGVPRKVRSLVAALLDEDPTRRPSAHDAMRILARAA